MADRSTKKRTSGPDLYLQVKMWPCVQLEGAQQKFYTWAQNLAKEPRREGLLLLFGIPNLGQFVTPHLPIVLKDEGIKYVSMDMFLPLAKSGKNGLFYSFKGTKTRESTRVGRRELAKKLIAEGYAVIFTRDWKYAALKTTHYLAGTYEQDPIPEGELP